jgi:uncharacterized lipoprotein YmbA
MKVVGVLGALAVAIAGCSILGPQPDRARFFTLTSMAPAESVETAGLPPADALVLGVGPIELPAYLDRPEVATRVSANEIRFSPIDRWAEPLRSNFAAVLQEDLAMAVGTRRIVGFPWHHRVAVAYAVSVDLLRFERTQAGDGELAAHWRIADGASGALLLARDSVMHHAADGKTTEAAVAALSRAVAELSRDIASGLVQLDGRRRRGEER